ncbi:MAG: GtrA family protein [Anaerolineales bacterium]|nr:GtrA family protein [Anaerolineales bacterium]
MIKTTVLSALSFRKLPRYVRFARFARFLTVGAVGTLLDFTLLTLLKLAGMPTLPANTLSFTAGLINNFIGNRLWTFGDKKWDGLSKAHPTSNPWHRQFIQFTLISLVGLTLNNLIVLALEAPLGTLLGQLAWGYLPAKFFATGLVVFWNYFANRKWTFSEN